ncbi:hypothetical protein G6M86_04725 [Agrobacterium tumefaciens]|uniref:Uncharacterized protein n=1 Tax=Agrobacterium tumefaciens TaxID=358 RepID=A0AAJ4N0N3_AGRTU|nr:hypothetical protein G6M86_04725 [Agrobacterium tumefaciens]
MTERPTDLIVETADIPVARISRNTTQDLIYITEDRLELRLRDYTEQINKRKQLSGPGGTLLTFAGALTTATFNDFWGLNASQIKMIFYAGTCLSLAWLIWALCSRIASEKPSISKVMAKIRNDEQSVAN